MPAKTAKQRRAMHAAAAGKSTIGIPKSVGQEFVGAGGSNTPQRRVPPQQNPQALQMAIMDQMRRKK